VLDTLGAEARSRIELVRSGLRSILDVLSKRAGVATLAALPSNGSRGKSTAAARTAGKGVPAATRRSATQQRMAAKRADSGKRTSAAKRSTAARTMKNGKRKRASA
jgi:hypothetical protein